MTVPIDVPAALIFLVSCAVGWAVYRHTRTKSTTLPQEGDLGVAFGAVLVALTALAFLFGVSADRDASPASQHPDVIATVPPAANTSDQPLAPERDTVRSG